MHFLYQQVLTEQIKPGGISRKYFDLKKGIHTRNCWEQLLYSMAISFQLQTVQF